MSPAFSSIECIFVHSTSCSIASCHLLKLAGRNLSERATPRTPGSPQTQRAEPGTARSAFFASVTRPSSNQAVTIAVSFLEEDSHILFCTKQSQRQLTQSSALSLILGSTFPWILKGHTCSECLWELTWTGRGELKEALVRISCHPWLLASVSENDTHFQFTLGISCGKQMTRSSRVQCPALFQYSKLRREKTNRPAQPIEALFPATALDPFNQISPRMRDMFIFIAALRQASGLHLL